MYSYIVHDGISSREEVLKIIFKFSHLLIRGLIKGLSASLATYSTLSMKMYRYIVLGSSTPTDEFLKSIFKFSELLIRGLIKGLSTN